MIGYARNHEPCVIFKDVIDADGFLGELMKLSGHWWRCARPSVIREASPYHFVSLLALEPGGWPRLIKTDEGHHGHQSPGYTGSEIGIPLLFPVTRLV